MTIYLVSYDLNKPGQDYSAIIGAISRNYDHCQVLMSQWLISTDQTATEVYNNLIKYVDNTDGLLVTEVTDNSASYMNAEAISWAHHHGLNFPMQTSPKGFLSSELLVPKQ